MSLDFETREKFDQLGEKLDDLAKTLASIEERLEALEGPTEEEG